MGRGELCCPVDILLFLFYTNTKITVPKFCKKQVVPALYRQKYCINQQESIIKYPVQILPLSMTKALKVVCRFLIKHKKLPVYFYVPIDKKLDCFVQMSFFVAGTYWPLL